MPISLCAYRPRERGHLPLSLPVPYLSLIPIAKLDTMRVFSPSYSCLSDKPATQSPGMPSTASWGGSQARTSQSLNLHSLILSTASAPLLCVFSLLSWALSFSLSFVSQMLFLISWVSMLSFLTANDICQRTTCTVQFSPSTSVGPGN